MYQFNSASVQIFLAFVQPIGRMPIRRENFPSASTLPGPKAVGFCDF
jgi:hypothetical protein